MHAAPLTTLFCLTVVGCADGTTDPDWDTLAERACPTSVQNRLTDPGEDGVVPPGTATLTLEVLADDPLAYVDVFVDGGGTDGWQTVQVVDGLASVRTAELAPDTAYVVQVRACEGTEVYAHGFSTLPPPVTGLDGTTFIADLLDPRATWHAPAGVSRDLLVWLYADDHNMALHIVEHDTQAGTLRLAFSPADLEEGSVVQEACLGPAVLDPIDFSLNPTYDRPPSDITLREYPDTPSPLLDFALQGTFVEDDSGRWIKDFRLQTTIDLRPAGDALRTMVCGQLDDGACVPCDDQSDTDEAPGCVPMDVTVPRADASDLTWDPWFVPTESCG